MRGKTIERRAVMAGGAGVVVISALRAVVEVGMLALLGQGLLALLAGPGRASNPIYRMFLVITAPVLRVARCAAPRRILDRHLPYVAFFVLFWLWILLAFIRQRLLFQ